MRDGTSPQTTVRVLRNLIEIAEKEGVTALSVPALRAALDQLAERR